jgi:hypothetical protein
LSVVSGFDLRYSGNGPWRHLQAQDMFANLINYDYPPISITVEEKLFTFTRAGISESLIHVPSPASGASQRRRGSPTTMDETRETRTQAGDHQTTR